MSPRTECALRVNAASERRDRVYEACCHCLYGRVIVLVTPVESQCFLCTSLFLAYPLLQYVTTEILLPVRVKTANRSVFLREVRAARHLFPHLQLLQLPLCHLPHCLITVAPEREHQRHLTFPDVPVRRAALAAHDVNHDLDAAARVAGLAQAVRRERAAVRRVYGRVVGDARLVAAAVLRREEGRAEVAELEAEAAQPEGLDLFVQRLGEAWIS